MAFGGFRKKIGGGNKPALNIQASVKVGDSYEKSGYIGLFPNDKGGPAFTGTLKGEYLQQYIEFWKAVEQAGIESVRFSCFDNRESRPSGGFQKQGGFQKKNSFSLPPGTRKPNPFKQQPEQEQDEQEEPEF